MSEEPDVARDAVADGAVITVRGQWEQDFPPDRAAVDLSVNTSGTERASVLDDAASTAERVRSLIEGQHDADRGPVTSWSSEQIHVWEQEDFDKQGKPRAPRHYATVRLGVVFGDVGALSAFVDEVAGWEHIKIDYVRWDLTPPRRREADREVRRHAVDDARQRAEDYAAAAGLGAIAVSSIADLGMLGGGDDQPRPVALGAARVANWVEQGGNGPAFFYVPQDVTVRAAVDMRFRSG